jgi:hypothetical protein
MSSDKKKSPLSSSQQRALAEWRRVDLTSVEKAFADRAQPVGALLAQVLTDMHLDQRRTDVEILKVWNVMLGPQLTAHAQPVNLHKGTLFVKVDSSVWLSEIVRYHRKEILERLQHCFGKDLIVKISFRIG